MFLSLSWFEDGTNRVWRLHHALHGHKQAANTWHKAFLSAMQGICHISSLVDPVVFVREFSRVTCTVHSHIDNCSGTGPPEEIDSNCVKLLQQFDGRFPGECDGQVFLGTQTAQN